MQISINGPLAGRINFLSALGHFSRVLRSTGWTPPSREVAQVIHLACGYEQTATEEELSVYTDEDINKFYRERAIANVSGYVCILSDWIRVRLTMLDSIGEPRQQTALNDQRAPRYFYNLGRDTAVDINRMIELANDNPGTFDIYTLNRLMERINAEATLTIGQVGYISPNARCDDVVRALLDFHPVMIAAVARTGERLMGSLADYLDMYLNIAKLYFGAVNRRDDEISTQRTGPVGIEKLRVGNDIIVCLPAPTFEMLKSFESKTASVIDPVAVRYISALECAPMGSS